MLHCDKTILNKQIIKMKPNIFNISTKELSQDAFLTWLLLWADTGNSDHDTKLNKCGVDFIKELIKKEIPEFNEEIRTVLAERQRSHIDIWVVVNDKYLIIIEDKINTGQHSDQLSRYKNIAENWCNEQIPKYPSPVCIYLKTGNECRQSLNNVTEEGFKIYNRKEFISFLDKHEIENDIYKDFKAYLNAIEDSTNSYIKFENITSDWRACEGFYIILQENINEKTYWKYVSNPKGGFLCFHSHSKMVNKIGEIYFQIENAIGKEIKLVIKISNWEPSEKPLDRLLDEIKPYAEKNGLNINKPKRYSAGETSTLAIIDNAFPIDNENNIDIEQFILTLNKLEQTLDEYCKNR